MGTYKLQLTQSLDPILSRLRPCSFATSPALYEWGMSRSRRPDRDKNRNGANLNFAATLWFAADKLQNGMGVAEYKQVVLGLSFLKYISDALEKEHTAIVLERDSRARLDYPDEYGAQSIFSVPPEARWAHLAGCGKTRRWRTAR